MAEFTQAQIDGVGAACRDNAEALAESLNLCFDRSYRLEPQQPAAWDAENVEPALDGPGLIVALDVAGQAVLALIPVSLPLPEWFTIPNESEQSRLQTLAMEWSINMLPTDVPADDFRTFATENLANEVAAAGTTDSTTVLALRVHEKSSGNETGAGEASGGEPAGEETESGGSAAEEPDGGEGTAGTAPPAIYVVFPVAQAPVPVSNEPDETPPPASESPQREAGDEAPSAPARAGRHDRQLCELPVTVSVRLAEKRIGLRQLLSLTPGALITFGKSCEELLDLYVNNHPHCRGEAVKIGEKFGLKINEIGQPKRREKRVL